MTNKNYKWFFLIFLLSNGSGTIYLTPFFLNQYINQVQILAGESLTNLKLLISIYGIVSSILYAPSGWVANRFSPKLLFVSNLFLTSIITTWYSLVSLNDIINFAQLTIIHIIFACINSLTF